MLRAGYAADWPPEILGRVGRKIQKANFAETQNKAAEQVLGAVAGLVHAVVVTVSVHPGVVP